ncbi:MAG TPA: transposase, partial [Cytophagales bacterium]|nr:transposase [Cytophagales bacterium]
DQQRIYFLTFTVVQWIDVFIQDEYREIFLESTRYCQQHKGLEVYAWCLMTSHAHLILGTTGENKLEHIIRDYKSYTSRKIRQAIEENERESRRDWMLRMMYFTGTRNAHNKDFQFWHPSYHPVELSSPLLVE